MQIYILRHGIAEDRGRGPDAERALTGDGRKKLQRVLKCAAKAGVKPARILSSPYRRARETAEVAAEILGVEGKIVDTDTLLPEAKPDGLWEEIRARRQEDSLLLAGHEPMLSASVAFLLGVPTLKVDLKKGALVQIDLERFGPRPHGILRWMLTPRLSAAASR